MSQFQFSPTVDKTRHELASDFGRCLSRFLALGAYDGQEMISAGKVQQARRGLDLVFGSKEGLIAAAWMVGMLGSR